MTCTCMTEIDARLAEHNTRLASMMMFSPAHTLPVIETEVLTKKRGARPVVMFPSYCPFCGAAYPERRGGDVAPTVQPA